MNNKSFQSVLQDEFDVAIECDHLVAVVNGESICMQSLVNPQDWNDVIYRETLLRNPEIANINLICPLCLSPIDWMQIAKELADGD